jgi:Uma2 family endonuclease
MVATINKSALPETLEEFLAWEPNDGYKYEWNDGEIIKFKGMDRKQIFIFDALNELFYKKGLNKKGTLIPETDVWLTGLQMRRPDIPYFTKEQIRLGREGEDIVPEFAIEVISGNDILNKVEEKLTEYFKYGVRVVWLILPESESVHVYTSRRDVKICFGDDVCSASPVLDEFEITVNQIFQ